MSIYVYYDYRWIFMFIMITEEYLCLLWLPTPCASAPTLNHSLGLSQLRSYRARRSQWCRFFSKRREDVHCEKGQFWWSFCVHFSPVWLWLVSSATWLDCVRICPPRQQSQVMSDDDYDRFLYILLVKKSDRSHFSVMCLEIIRPFDPLSTLHPNTRPRVTFHSHHIPTEPSSRHGRSARPIAVSISAGLS